MARPLYIIDAVARQREIRNIIPPAAQRMMASRAVAHVSEAPDSHAIYVSSPEVVADVIRQAAK